MLTDRYCERREWIGGGVFCVHDISNAVSGVQSYSMNKIQKLA